MGRIFREADGAVPNSLAIGYAMGGSVLGLYLITAGSLLVNAAGTLLLAHAMVIAAYLIHEFAHGSIFRARRLNEGFGRLMTWLTGGCYATFDQIRIKHMRHHADRLDIVTFDYRALLRRFAGLRRMVEALEWAYVPAADLLMHLFVIALPFYSPHPYHRANQGRVVSILLIRAALFGLLVWYSPKALIFYTIAYLGMVTLLRFNDAFQHTYPLVPLLSRETPEDLERPEREFEYHNTFSNLASSRWPWLNLLTLNFPYHNTHHEKPSVPWYRLPALHRDLFRESDAQVITWRQLFGAFHRYRVRRVMDDDCGAVADQGEARADHFVGAVGVSFLTSV